MSAAPCEVPSDRRAQTSHPGCYKLRVVLTPSPRLYSPTRALPCDLVFRDTFRVWCYF